MLAPSAVTDTRRRFARLAARPDSRIDLGEAALLIAAEARPELDLEAQMGHLDRLALAVEERLADRSGLSDFERFQGLVEHLFGDGDSQGARAFRGNRSDYYDPDNSFLDQVLERRLGIPITLAVVALEVAKRLHIPLVGIGFPGHFLIGHPGHPQILFDPFEGGALLSLDDCRALLERMTGGALPFHRRLLQPVGTRQILTRMLNNLRAIYLRRGALAEALGVLDRLILLDPRDAVARRDRGLLRLQAGLVEGVEDLRGYLQAEAEAPDREEIQSLIIEARPLSVH